MTAAVELPRAAVRSGVSVALELTRGVLWKGIEMGMGQVPTHYRHCRQLGGCDVFFFRGGCVNAFAPEHAVSNLPPSFIRRRLGPTVETTHDAQADHWHIFNDMSSEEDYNDLDSSSAAVPDSKKRRVQRACDTCRRKKSQYEFFAFIPGVVR